MSPLLDAVRFRRDYLSLQLEYRRLRGSAHAESELVRTLMRDGLVVIPDYYDADTTSALRDAIPPLERCRITPEGTGARIFLEADTVAGLEPFFTDRTISAAMRGVLGPRTTMFRSFVQYRVDTGQTGVFEQFFHIDTWRPRYKAFLYLNDVDEANGPFTYTPRTHHGAWRTRYDVDIARVFRTDAEGLIGDEQSAYVGCLWPHEYARVCRQLGTAPVAATGKAGTLILFDARGLHRIPPMDRAPRIILSSYWIREGQHV